MGGYDPDLPLIIDPLLASTFLGGNDGDYAQDIAIDSSDNVYVLGSTLSTDFPATSGVFNQHLNGDVFIAKFDSDLTTLMASAILGGNYGDEGYSIVIDSSDNVYVTGDTASSDFPCDPWSV